MGFNSETIMDIADFIASDEVVERFDIKGVIFYLEKNLQIHDCDRIPGVLSVYFETPSKRCWKLVKKIHDLNISAATYVLYPDAWLKEKLEKKGWHTSQCPNYHYKLT